MIAAAARSFGEHHAIGRELLVEHREIDALEHVRRVGRLEQHGVGGMARPAGHVRGAEIGGIELGAGDLRPAVDAARGGRRVAPPPGSDAASRACRSSVPAPAAASGRTITAMPATSEAFRNVRRSTAPVNDPISMSLPPLEIA